MVVDRVAVAARAGAVGGDPLEVEVGEDQLLVVGEALALGQQVAVLVDQRLPVPGQVGGRLAEPGGRVHVAGDRPRRLRGAQRAAVVGLAHGDVAGRQVRQHGRPGQRAVGARRDRRPQVLADLHVERERREVAAREHQVGAERDVGVQQAQLAADRIARGPELALLVELAVLGQVALGDDAEHAAPMDHHRGVEQPELGVQRRADDDHRRQRGAGVRDPFDRLDHGVGQRLLVQQVVDRVAGDAQLREDHQRGVGVRGARGQRERPLGVVVGIADPDVRDRGGHAREAVPVERVEV